MVAEAKMEMMACVVGRKVRCKIQVQQKIGVWAGLSTGGPSRTDQLHKGGETRFSVEVVLGGGAPCSGSIFLSGQLERDQAKTGQNKK